MSSNFFMIFIPNQTLLSAMYICISLYSIKHPKKIMRLAQRTIGAIGLIRTLQNSFKKTSD